MIPCSIRSFPHESIKINELKSCLADEIVVSPLDNTVMVADGSSLEVKDEIQNQ